MNILDSSIKHIHLTGYKGVAMASLAQVLTDIGKVLSGSDLAEKFVTQKLLDSLAITTHNGFDESHVPSNTDLLIYTAAHNGPQNSEVIWAKEHNIPTFSQAEALAQLFNTKKGIAVCGVGGKSTTSAMVSWIFEKVGKPVSFSVGVGNIPGLEKTGQWVSESEYFVAEADEYVIDPSARKNHQPIVPRFSFLKPWIIVCTKLAFDHPDVYEDFEETKKTFLSFFSQIQEHGHIVINADQPELVDLSHQLSEIRPDITIHTFGFTQNADAHIINYAYKPSGELTASWEFQTQSEQITLRVPGKHNLLNAVAACVSAYVAQIPVVQALDTLSSFNSTQRRFEYKGQKNTVVYYDDYAHHPSELKILAETLKEMFPQKNIFFAFQPHTFSRTRALFDQFVEVLGTLDHLILTDIFPSAREQLDPTMTSKLLVDILEKKHPNQDLIYLPTLEELAQFAQTKIPDHSVFITVGAGDIYTIYDKIPDLTK